ncbi:MAG: DUF515 domain-containing protein [Candidatus Hydrothermarchaeales archaeon]
MPDAKKDDDIVGRLEALRKKIPAEKKEVPAAAPAPATPAEAPGEEEPDKRKKLARIVGIVVVLIIVGVVATVGLKMFTAGKEKEGTKTAEAQKAAAEAQKAQKAAEERKAAEAKLSAEEAARLESAKLNKTVEVKEAFKGTPTDLGTEKQKVLEQIQSAKTIQEIEAIDGNAIVDDAWEVVMKSLMDEAKTEAETKAAEFEAIGMQVGTVAYSGLEGIKRQIDQLSYDELKNVYFFEIGIEYVPIRLEREQFTGGFVEVGDSINIHYIITDDEGLPNQSTRAEYLAKDGKVMAIMRAQSSGIIELSESELKTDTGGGSEGKGTITTLSIGSLGSVTPGSDFFDASVGYKMRQSQSTYNVDISEIQKAAAASKIPESYITTSLEEYGVKLNTIERETNIGDFGAGLEYLMLVEMDEIEASKVVSKLIDDEERGKLLATISKPKPASWMEKID